MVNSIFNPLISENIPKEEWEKCEKEITDEFFNSINLFGENLEDSITNLK